MQNSLYPHGDERVSGLAAGLGSPVRGEEPVEVTLMGGATYRPAGLSYDKAAKSQEAFAASLARMQRKTLLAHAPDRIPFKEPRRVRRPARASVVNEIAFVLSSLFWDMRGGFKSAITHFQVTVLALLGATEVILGAFTTPLVGVIGVMTLVFVFAISRDRRTARPARPRSQDEQIADLRERFAADPDSYYAQFESDLEHLLAPDMIWTRPFR